MRRIHEVRTEKADSEVVLLIATTDVALHAAAAHSQLEASVGGYLKFVRIVSDGATPSED